MPNMLKQRAVFVHNCVMTFPTFSSEQVTFFGVPFDLYAVIVL